MNSSSTQSHLDLDHRESDALGFMPRMPAPGRCGELRRQWHSPRRPKPTPSSHFR
jgi:hypothetical protein